MPIVNDTPRRVPSSAKSPDENGVAVPKQKSKPTARITTPNPSNRKKSDLVLTLLRRNKGATIEQLKEPTAWQSHSLRAFISGLRKQGITIVRSKTKEGATLYRVEKS